MKGDSPELYSHGSVTDVGESIIAASGEIVMAVEAASISAQKSDMMTINHELGIRKKKIN